MSQVLGTGMMADELRSSRTSAFDRVLGARVWDGRLKPLVDAVLPLAKAAAAFAPDKRSPGKTIPRVAED